MPSTLQTGTILIKDWTFETERLGLESNLFEGSWHSIAAIDSFTLDVTLRDAGWTFFFVAGEIQAKVLGTAGSNNLRKAVGRILERVNRQHYNGVEITGIIAKHFLGVPYTVVSAHARHIQQSCYLDSLSARRVSARNAELSRA